MNERNTCIYKYTTHFILERGTPFVVSLRDRWRDIYSERGHLLAPYLLPGSRGCQRLHLLVSRIVRDPNASSRLRVPHSTLDSRFLVLSWFSSCGLLPVTHLLVPTALTRCHPPVYKSQRDSLSKHTRVTRNEPKIHVICYITPGSDGNEGILHILQSWSIAGTSSSDCLVSCLIPLQKCSQCILQP